MSGAGHVVVVGGGVSGCATAYYLSAAGARVTLIEREGIGSQASGWSAGGVNPLQDIPAPVAALALASYRLHLELWPELQRLTGLDFEARRISMALVAPSEADVPGRLALGKAFSSTEGFSARWLDAAELRALEPRVAPTVAGALLTQGNGVVESQRLTAALAAAAERHGAAVRIGTVTGIQDTDRRVTGVLLGEMVLPCDAVVLALGPWAQAAEAWLGWPLPVEPLKGEILRLMLAGPPLACDLVAPGVSLFGRTDGQVWVGSTRERRGFDREPSASAYRTLLDAAVALMPSLTDATLVRQTACLRPLSPDDLPVVGRVPDWEGAYLATGGGAKGILFAPALGRALADLILTGTTDLPIEAASPRRFAPVTG